MNRISLIFIKFKLVNSFVIIEIVLKFYFVIVVKFFLELEYEFLKVIV